MEKGAYRRVFIITDYKRIANQADNEISYHINREWSNPKFQKQ